MASILPTTNSNIYHQDGRGGYRSKKSTFFFHRLVRFPQMDFEFALWQMGYLLIAPRRVYRNIYYHKQTKNQWSRDDPAFVVLLITFLTIAAIVWSFTYSYGFYDTIKTILSMVLIHFLLIGALISTITW
ncbi:unnamed protein product [Mucor hiemalis]